MNKLLEKLSEPVNKFGSDRLKIKRRDEEIKMLEDFYQSTKELIAKRYSGIDILDFEALDNLKGNKNVNLKLKLAKRKLEPVDTVVNDSWWKIEYAQNQLVREQKKLVRGQRKLVQEQRNTIKNQTRMFWFLLFVFVIVMNPELVTRGFCEVTRLYDEHSPKIAEWYVMNTAKAEMVYESIEKNVGKYRQKVSENVSEKVSEMLKRN